MLKHYHLPNLSVRFAKSASEIRAAQRLRYRVFVEELGAKASASDQAKRHETDVFDAASHHLCLFDQEREMFDPENAVVGVYRLTLEEDAHANGGFYSEGEFDLGGLLLRPGRKLELGRSCVAPEYRGGEAIAMLWNALGQFIYEENISHLFGTASYHGTDTTPYLASLSHLHHKHLSPESWRTKSLDRAYENLTLLAPDAYSQLEAMKATPSLIKSYLRLGGTIGEGVFIDHDFNTVDVFVHIDTTRLMNRYKALHDKQIQTLG